MASTRILLRSVQSSCRAVAAAASSSLTARTLYTTTRATAAAASAAVSAQNGSTATAAVGTLYYNPACSKSRTTVRLLQDNINEGEVRLVNYVATPPSLEQLQELRAKLKAPAIEWVRHKETAFVEAGLTSGSPDEEVFAAVLQTPTLLERPILVYKDAAVVARPPQRALDLVVASSAATATSKES